MPKDSIIVEHINPAEDTVRSVVIIPRTLHHQQESDDSPAFFYVVAFIVFLVLALRLIGLRLDRKRRENMEATYTVPEQTLPEEPGALIYPGNELRFPPEEIDRVLTKHLPYYVKLPDTEKERFRFRLQKFMQSKIFVIYDKIGFKEMPILLSATAIKLSFGLKNYLLPFYRSIHIFPEEFWGIEPSIRVLAGNVSGNRIHVSWKHFLEGIKDPEDGSNLGLHEMAHAYYFQNLETGKPEDESFADRFKTFNTYGNGVFEQKRISGNVLYSKYAMTQFQEFWAESVELFFEKPHALQKEYPQLYHLMTLLLNQHPDKDADHVA